MSQAAESLHPVSLHDALPEGERVEEVAAALREAGVEWVLSCWIDLLGVPKTKPVPLHRFRELCAGRGPQFAVHSVSMVPELGPADLDQVAVPDLDSVVVCPWDSRLAWVFADLFWDDRPYDVCPRLALKRQVGRAAEAGLHVHAGFEPEFIVLRERDGRLEKAFADDGPAIGGERIKRQPYGYDAEHSLDGLPFLSDVARAMEQLGWGLSNVVCEGAFSQFELDFHHSGAVEAADRLTFLRVMLKEIAKRHDLIVTFMAKPTDGDWRSGAHINHSFAPLGDPDANLFAADDGGWGEAVLPAVGGLLEHGAALTAVACSTVNSYKGLTGTVAALDGGTLTWAPTHISYGHNNRSAMLRLPQSRRAIENRACDMSVNAYLALAMTIGASLEGLARRTDPGVPLDRPAYDLTAADMEALGTRRLPETLIEAIGAFEGDALAREVFGDTMHELYTRYKRTEWRRFHERVTEWEQVEYLRFF
jgi:glutamine synthetase